MKKTPKTNEELAFTNKYNYFRLFNTGFIFLFI